MNIFESIERSTRRMEPFHSQFLADALQESIEGDRSLFDAVWRLTSPKEWEVPVEVTIGAEEIVPGHGRIDICVRCESPTRRIVGIEVKTTDSSATEGQLKRYLEGLAEEFSGYEVAIAYLTPFNRHWAPDKADALPTVKAFDEFVKSHRVARHVSWLDIAAIPWNGSELWRQHQLYVYQHISSSKELHMSTTRDRSLDEFFDGECVDAFWKALSELGIESVDGGADIQLAQFKHDQDFASRLAQSFQVLIMEGATDREEKNKFSEEKRSRFLDSEYGQVHEALFALADRYGHVWIEGKGRYGVRVAHSKHRSSGVSLVTSNGPERLKIVGQR